MANIYSSHRYKQDSQTSFLASLYLRILLLLLLVQLPHQSVLVTYQATRFVLLADYAWTEAMITSSETT